MAFIKSFLHTGSELSSSPRSQIRNSPALCRAKGIELGEQVTIFVGDNGCGKSTLLESIAYSIDIPLIGGRIGGC